ncbi:hypothetical protein PCASD_08880 [Puccinia coronata f. sp. avenae]|uniref:Uncharacterized protein n=1 Tax=Puccinia coronata f. sp. avenae TaxID=200324 RepID=A0A2N5UUE5_9BASI|nr:hypothetical protein PCASD_08880 [Puccinia coronata f. sp. avenae]
MAQSEWSAEQIIQLRGILLTQTSIQPDWDWSKVQVDLMILSDLVGLKFEPYHEPSAEILSSGLMSYEPNRSTHAISQLPNFNTNYNTPTPRNLINVPREYHPSITTAARFLFSHLPGFEANLNQSIFALQSRHPPLFRLITEFSKVYQARLMIYEVCLTEWAFEKLVAWDQSLQTKNLDFFDDEPDRFSKAKALLGSELARGSKEEECADDGTWS